MLPPLTFPPFFLGNKGTLSQCIWTQRLQHSCRQSEGWTPTIPHNHLAHFGCAHWQSGGSFISGTLIVVPLSARSNVAHSLLFLWLTQKCRSQSGWKPLLSWPLFFGGNLRGVLTSGLNENIRQVGYLTGLPVTKFSTIGAEVQFCWVKL